MQRKHNLRGQGEKAGVRLGLHGVSGRGTKYVSSAFALLDSTVLTPLSHVPAPAPPKPEVPLKRSPRAITCLAATRHRSEDGHLVRSTIKGQEAGKTTNPFLLPGTKPSASPIG